MNMRTPFNETLAEIVNSFAPGFWLSGQRDLARDLREVAKAIPRFPRTLMSWRYCPFCATKYTVVDYRKLYPYGEEMVVHKMRAIHRYCDKDPARTMFAYQAIWRCTNPDCQEVEEL